MCSPIPRGAGCFLCPVAPVPETVIFMVICNILRRKLCGFTTTICNDLATFA
jgi:hypothetical protein